MILCIKSIEVCSATVDRGSDPGITINDKSVDGVLGTQTRGGRMVGTDESTELWRPPPIINILCIVLSMRAK